MNTQQTAAAKAHHADAMAIVEACRAELAKTEAEAQPIHEALAKLRADFKADGKPATLTKIAEAESKLEARVPFVARARELLADAETNAAAAHRAALEAEHAEALAMIGDEQIAADLAPMAERFARATADRFEAVLSAFNYADELRARYQRAAGLARQIGAPTPRDVQAHIIENRMVRMAEERRSSLLKVDPRDPRRSLALRMAR